MLKNNFIIGALSVLLLLGLSGIASAGEGGEGNSSHILGPAAFDSNSPETKAERAAVIHVYDQNTLSRLGTEAGWESSFDAPNQNDSGTMAGHEMKSDAKCSNC